jgi:CheY-like chemotaxis protein
MKKHIFLIDDDEDELEIFHEALKLLPLPCKCTYAGSADHAMQMLQYLTPDLIFIDINMPRLNGFDFLAEIKKDEHLKHIPLFMYSNGIDKEIQAKAIKMGATGCIKKSNSIKSLTEDLNKIVSLSVSL